MLNFSHFRSVQNVFHYACWLYKFIAPLPNREILRAWWVMCVCVCVCLFLRVYVRVRICFCTHGNKVNMTQINTDSSFHLLTVIGAP